MHNHDATVHTVHPARRQHYRHLDLRHRAREMAGLSEAMTGHCAQALNVRLGIRLGDFEHVGMPNISIT
jgi:hypothetical protein